MKIGLFFGSFNPIHNGHLMVANYMLEYTDIDQVHFVLSPQNPFKQKKNLLDDYHRLAMLEEAVGESDRYRVCDIELKMPKPSYTIDTLTYMKERRPSDDLVLLMGADNLKHFHKWKNADEILKQHEIKVYARKGSDNLPLAEHPKVTFYNAPQIEISSSFIRQAVKDKKEIPYFMPPAAYRYMREMHFYE